MSTKPILVIRVPEAMEFEGDGLTGILNDYHVIYDVILSEDVTKVEFEVHSVEKATELNPEKLNKLIELISKKTIAL